MWLVLLLAFVVVLVGGTLGWALWSSRVRPGQQAMRLLGSAAGQEELHLWTQALRGHGIRYHVVYRRVPTPQYLSFGPYDYEVWVLAKEQDKARAVLGV